MTEPAHAFDSETTPNDLTDVVGQDWAYSDTPPSVPERLGETYTDAQTGQPVYVQPADHPLSNIPTSDKD